MHEHNMGIVDTHFINYQQKRETTHKNLVATKTKSSTTKTQVRRWDNQTTQTTNRDNLDTKRIARSLLSEYGWENQMEYLETLWGKESGWQAGRLNKSSFACGIPQALPCTKIYSDFKSMEHIYINNKLFLKNPDAEKEIRWGLNYIKSRYGNPYKALQFHKVHNWY